MFTSFLDHNHNLDSTDYASVQAPPNVHVLPGRRKRFVEHTLSITNPRDFYAVMAMPDDILEATQSYTITLSSTNANVNPASLTINILDANNGTLSIYISIS